MNIEIKEEKGPQRTPFNFKQYLVLWNLTLGWNSRISSILLCPVTLTWVDSQDGPLSKCQLSIASTTSISTALEAFTRTLGRLLKLTDFLLFLFWGEWTHPKGPSAVRLSFFPLKVGRPFPPLVLEHWPAASPQGRLPASHLSPFPLVFVLRLYWFLMFSISLSKGLISILRIIFRTISLISFQDMSSHPLEVSHISDDNELITRRQEESVQLFGDWPELDEV